MEGLKPERLKNVIDFIITKNKMYLDKAYIHTEKSNWSITNKTTRSDKLLEILKPIEETQKLVINKYLSTLKLIDFKEFKTPVSINIHDIISRSSFRIPIFEADIIK